MIARNAVAIEQRFSNREAEKRLGSVHEERISESIGRIGVRDEIWH